MNSIASATSSYSTAELMEWARGQLEGIEGANPRMDARALMEWVCGVDSWWAVPNEIGSHSAEKFRSGVARRRHREPLQHIVGKMWFRHITLDVEPGVFISRPETEYVTQVAIDRARALTERALTPRVVDLCTGSGAIALSIATEVAQTQVYAVELMPTPYEVALRNVGNIAPGRIHLVRGNALSVCPEWDGTMDIVISNPPYVPSNDVTQIEALHDPHEALYGGGEDGLIIPRGIIHRARALLKPGGLLVMEHAEKQSAQLRETARSEGFTHVETRTDLTGRDRMLVAEL